MPTFDILHCDYESRSRVDLTARGVYNYAMSKTTKVLFMSWAFNDDPPELWKPGGSPFPKRVIDHWRKGGRRGTHAHNAAFERLITKYVLPQYLTPAQRKVVAKIPLDHWYCSAAQARARGMPASLDNLARCVGGEQKDARGKNLIRKLCIPWSGNKIDFENGEFNDDPDLMEVFGIYCLQDTVTERSTALATPPLTDTEFEDYVITEKINDRGILVDDEFATAALSYADQELTQIHGQISDLTRGKITTARQFQRIKDFIAPWIEQHDLLRKLVTRHKTDRKTGETKVSQSLDKAARYDILSADYEWPDDLVELIELLDLAGSTSVSKYRAMLDRQCADGRLRGAYVFCGAQQTKRFSSTGAQLHNIRRDTPKNFHDTIRVKVIAREPINDVMNTLASSLRPTLKAPPKSKFRAADYSAIEARVLPWLTDSKGGDAKLQMFRDGIDVYINTADDIFPGRGEELRQLGKVAELSLGYQGGERAFLSMARNFRLPVDRHLATTIKDGWRLNNQWCVRYWRECEDAAMDAFRSPGDRKDAGRIYYVYDEEWETLYCVAPNGAAISYPNPAVVETQYGYALSSVKGNWTPAAGETAWPRVQLYGGLLVENATQFVACEVLKEALRILDRKKANIVAHTHDEIVLEDRSARINLVAAMTTEQKWRAGLPLEADLWENDRYAKP